MFYLIGCLNFKDFYTNILFSNRMSLLSWAPLFFFFFDLKFLRLLISCAPLPSSAIVLLSMTVYHPGNSWQKQQSCIFLMSL